MNLQMVKEEIRICEDIITRARSIYGPYTRGKIIEAAESYRDELVKTAHGEDLSQWTLMQIVHQLEICGFDCEAGSLETNAAFVELKRRAAEEAKKEIDKEWVLVEESAVKEVKSIIKAIRYAIAIELNGKEQYVKDLSGEDAYTDDISKARLFHSRYEVPLLIAKHEHEYLVKIRINKEDKLEIIDRIKPSYLRKGE